MDKSHLKQIALLPLSKLQTNNGQIEGVPKNPRMLKKEKFEALKKSILEDPEMLELRELLVYPMQDETFVAIGGNMRLLALQELQYTEALCKILKTDTPIEKLKAYAIKDNNNYGEWDYDLLANEWDVEKLNEWGLDIHFDNSGNLNLDDFFDEGEQKEKEKSVVIEVVLSKEMEDNETEIRNAIEAAVQNYDGVKVK